MKFTITTLTTTGNAGTFINDTSTAQCIRVTVAGTYLITVNANYTAGTSNMPGNINIIVNGNTYKSNFFTYATSALDRDGATMSLVAYIPAPTGGSSGTPVVVTVTNTSTNAGSWTLNGGTSPYYTYVQMVCIS